MQKIEFSSLTDKTSFHRDFCISLPSGEWLFPATLTHMGVQLVNLRDVMASFFPSSMDHVYDDEKSMEYMIGFGFVQETRKEFLEKALLLNMPIKYSQCVFEGGNVYLFQNSLGEWKAIVGIASVMASLSILDMQGYFKYLDVSLLNKDAIASDDSIRAARNYDLFLEYRTILDKHRLKYLELCKAPLTPEERIKYSEKAKLFEVKLSCVKSIIAMDLGIPLHNIAFIPPILFSY